MGSSNQRVRRKTATIFRAARKLRGLKQDQVAKNFGVTQSMISKLESGVLSPDAGLWYDFCLSLNLSADLTYSSGLVFTKNSREKIVSNSFKLGVGPSEELVKVKECLSVIHAIESLGKGKDFEKYMKKKKIDIDIFCIPDALVPISVLVEVFSYYKENKGTGVNIYKTLSENFIVQAEVIFGGAPTTLHKLIWNLSQLQKVLVFKESTKTISLTMRPDFSFSIEEADSFYSYFIKLKAEQIKSYCESVLDIKKVEVNKVSDFNYEVVIG